MVSSPDCTSQCHLQTTTHSSSPATLRLSVPFLFSQTRLLIHILRCSFHLPASCLPFRTAPIRNGKLGGLRPLVSGQWDFTDQEWQTWWSSSWQTTPLRLSALGADRNAQSFNWPSPVTVMSQVPLQQEPHLDSAYGTATLQTTTPSMATPPPYQANTCDLPQQVPTCRERRPGTTPCTAPASWAFLSLRL